MIDFTEIREALAKMTTGEWFVYAEPEVNYGPDIHAPDHGVHPGWHSPVGLNDANVLAGIVTLRNRVPALLADRDQWKERAEKAEAAFLETRELLGLVEGVICEECCPTTWRTVDGQPHCKLHEDIKAVLAKYEAVRDAARATLEAGDAGR